MDQIKKKNSQKKKHKFFPLPYILVLDIKKKKTKYLSKSQIQSPKL